MRKIFIPTYQIKTIYDLDPAKLKGLGVEVMLSDLDNTLASYKCKDAEEKTIALVKKFKDNGIAFYIASNNTSKRVQRFASTLGVKALSGLRKPFSNRLKKMLTEEGLDKDKTVLVGDQVMTDVIAGNGAGIRTILTEKLVPEDPPWTRFNRLFEKGKRKVIVRDGLSKNL